MRNIKKLLLLLGVFFLCGINVSFGEETGKETLLFSDDMLDGRLHPYYEINRNGRSIEEDGYIQVNQAVIDQPSELISRWFPMGSEGLVLEYDFLSHPSTTASGPYFHGGVHLYVKGQNGKEELFLESDHTNTSYRNGSIPRIDKIETIFRLSPTSPLNFVPLTDGIHDEWVHHKIIIDTKNNKIIHEVNGISHEINADLSYWKDKDFRFWISPTGWWTGHYVRIKDINLKALGDVDYQEFIPIFYGSDYSHYEEKTLLFSDDMQDGILHPYYEINKNNRSTEGNGYIQVNQAVTDQPSDLISRWFPMGSGGFIFEYDFLSHPGEGYRGGSYLIGDYFYGQLYLQTKGENNTEEIFFSSQHLNSKTEKNIKGNFYITPNNLINVSSSDIIHDEWVHHKIIIDTRNNRIVHEINGISYEKYVDLSYWKDKDFRFGISPYGRWTGHYVRIKNISLNSLGNSYYQSTTPQTNLPIYQLNYSNYTETLQCKITDENKNLSSSLNNVAENINTSTEGDPVTLSTGEFTYNNTLISKKGWGNLPFNFEVTYRNQKQYDGPLGNNFDFNYNQFLVKKDNGNINYYDGKLGVWEFKKSGNDTFEYSKVLKGKLYIENGKYKLNLDNKKILTFNDKLRIESIEDNFSNIIRVAYDGDKIRQVFDTHGNIFDIKYYDYSRIKSIDSENSDESVEFIYYGANDNEGSEFDLKNIKLKTGDKEKEIKFTYTKNNVNEELSHNIVKLYDLNGNIYVENEYTNNRVTSQKYGDGIIYYNYTLNDNKVTENSVINKSGVNVVYTYDEFGNNTSMVIKGETDLVYTYEYNKDNRLIKEEYPNSAGVVFEYDTNGNLIEKRQVENVGANNYLPEENDLVTSYEYNNNDLLIKAISPSGVVIENEYGNSGELLKMTTKENDTASGNLITTFSYNSKGNIILKNDNGLKTSYTYFNGNLASLTRVGNNPGENVTTSFSYDTKGNIILETDELGNKTEYEYDEFNNLTKIIYPNNIINEFEYDNQNNNINTKQILQNNNITNTIETITNYDILDNPINSIFKVNGNTKKSSVTTYSADGEITSIETTGEAKVEFEYNRTGRVTKKTIIQNPNNPNENTVYNYEYDNVGNLTKVINPNNSITNYEYDKFGRLIKTIDDNGDYILLNYDKAGNIITKTDKNGNEFNYTYDYRGNILSESIGNNLLKTYTYDLLGNLTTATDGNDNTISYEYDSLRRKVKEIYEDNSYVTFSYDKMDNLIKITYPNGTIVNNTYDNLNRLTNRSITKGTNVEGVTSETYVYDDLGRLVSVSDDLGSIVEYEYDNLGRVTSETNGGKTVEYTYDNNNNLTSKLTPLGRYQYYSYDNLNRLTQIKSDNKVIADYNYDGLVLSSQELGNGLVDTYTYDNLYRLSNLNTSTKNFSYSYDNNSNITSDGEKSYTYDELDRLLTSDSILYAYDLVGNRSTDTINNLNQITERDSVSYSYDDVGNLKQDDTQKYYYDYKNRLTKVTDLNDNLITSYKYDIAGHRIEKTINDGTIIKYVYSGKNIILETKILPNEIELNKEYVYSNKVDDVVAVYVDEIKLVEVDSTQTPELFPTSQDGGGEEEVVNEEEELIDEKIFNEEEVTEESEEVIGEENLVLTEYKLISLNLPTVLAANVKEDNPNKGINNGNLNGAVKEDNPNKGTNNGNGTNNGVGNGNGTSNGNTNPSGNNGVGNGATKEDNPNKGSGNSNGNGNGNGGGGGGGGGGTFKKVIVTNLYFYEKNHLGTPIALSDKEGNIVEEYEVDEFGNITLGLDSEINDIFFTGKVFDREIGLYYFNARYYSPELGRFISRDPIGIVDDINLYAYVGNNPLKFVDPSGLSKAIIVLGRGKYDNEFDSMMNYYVNKFLKEGFNRNDIIIEHILSIDDFNNITEKYKGDINSITFIIHGNNTKLGLNSEFNSGNVSNLNSINNKNINLTLAACNTGKGDNSIAEQISNQLGVGVTAATSFIYPNKKPNYENSISEIIGGSIVYGITSMFSDEGEPTMLAPWGNWRTFIPNY